MNRSGTARRPAALGLVGACACIAVGCATGRPPRYVVEKDIDALVYGRYQRVLDLDLPIPGNPGEAHTAMYFSRAEDRPTPPSSAYVAVHDHAQGLASEVREALAGLETYRRGLVERSGHWLWSLAGDAGDRWLLWVSGRHVVKVGRAGDPVPEPLLEAYLSPYPSDLGADGRARAGAASAGPSAREREEAEAEEELPVDLRESPPR